MTFSNQIFNILNKTILSLFNESFSNFDIQLNEASKQSNFYQT